MAKRVRTDAAVTTPSPSTSSASAPVPSQSASPLPSQSTRPTAGSSQSRGTSQANNNKRRANRPDKRPAWLQPEPPIFSHAADTVQLYDVYGNVNLYVFPPPHLFYGLSETSRGLHVMLHNWLRIRGFWMHRVLNGARDDTTLMTQEEWRIALLGDYYRIQDLDRISVIPRCPEADHNALPLSQKTFKLRNTDVDPTKKRKGRKPGQMVDRYQDARLASRAEINVLFGRYGNFQPYDDDAGPHPWGSRSFNLENLREDPELWRQIIWELSLLNFRLEVVDVDRRLYPGGYTCGEDEVLRINAICEIWSDVGSLVPLWERRKGPSLDSLSTTDDEHLRCALRIFAKIMCVWPGGHAMDAYVSEACNMNATVYSRIISFYFHSAHTVLSRLPTIPLSLPSSFLHV